MLLQRAILFCVFLFSVVLGHGQLDMDTSYQKDDLLADLEQLKELIIDVHPSPYTFCTEEEAMAAWDKAENSVYDGMTVREFSLLVAEVFRVYKDSHSSLNFPVLREQYALQGGRFFNFKVKSTDDGLVVSEDIEGVIPKGSELIAINGRNAMGLYNAVSGFSIMEGNSLTGFKRITDALFPTYLGILSEVKFMNELVILPPGSSEPDTLKYRGYAKDDLMKRNRSVEGKSVYELNIMPEEDLAVLKIGSFAYRSNGRYYRFLRKSFKKIRQSGVGNVAIDLRSNTGGNANRMENLFTYIDEGDVIVPQNLIAKQSKSSKQRFEQQIGKWQRFWADFRAKRNENVAKYLTVIDLPIGQQDTVYFSTPEKRRKPKHTANHHLFIDGMSGSASANFAAVFKLKGLGTIYGESCLGPLSGTWGNPVNVQLENTGISVFISSIRFNTQSGFEYDAAPVLPDIPVQYSVKDLQDESDPYLKRLLEKIKEQ